MMPGVVYLVDVDEHQSGVPFLQPGQGGIDYLAVGSFVFAWRIKADIDRILRNQFLKPVIARNRSLQTCPVGSREKIVLGPGGDLVVIQVNGGSIAEIRPCAGQ
jgi:hypothetical protein